MSRIRLGGIKVIENRAYFSSLCHDSDALGEICSRLAADRVNLGLVTHIADIGTGRSVTAACAKHAGYFENFMHPKIGGSECPEKVLAESCSRISVFPHDQRPDITGALIRTLAACDIQVHCFGSSPSAITAVVSSSHFEVAMERIFDVFEFPACNSFEKWDADCRLQESLLQEVRCSYHEDVIHVYDFYHLEGIDLWNVTLPGDLLEDFAGALFDLGKLRLKMPFYVSNVSPGNGEMSVALCLATGQREDVRKVLSKRIPDRDDFCRGPVSVLFLHGPHFGDRYGITSALVTALATASIDVVGLSCTVSSITAVIRGSSRDELVAALRSKFQTPPV
jgi:aspartokinase